MITTKTTLEQLLENRRESLLFRDLPEKSHLIDFCSNDYLGFARSSELKKQIIEELKNFPEDRLGSTGSRLISGNSQYYEELESYIAQYHQAEAGLIFNSGYDANLGFYSSVPQFDDLVLFDESVHASIRDGLKLTRAQTASFRHNDLDDLKSKLNGSHNNIYIAVESVYSMDGDFAPLDEISELCKIYGANLVVDEAHATGLFGPKGEGRIVELGLQDDCFARVHTFGKALGCHGAVVLGSETLKQFLINFSRPFIFSTALPFYSQIAIKSAYDILSKGSDSLFKISELIKLFKEKIKARNEAWLIESSSPIQSLVIPGNDKAKQLSSCLEKAGFYAKAILYPTVPREKERIRFCFHSFNTKEEVMRLTEVINNYLT